MAKYDYKTMELRNGRICVHGWGTYQRGSVLEGQAKKQFIDCFDCVPDAKAQHPDAELSHSLMQPQNSFNHLPEEGDIEHLDDGY